MTKTYFGHTQTPANADLDGVVGDVRELVVNVKASPHNALGVDGNDTVALQSGIAAGTSGEVLVPSGVYPTSAQQAPGAGSTVRGMGRGSVLKTTVVSTHLFAVAAAGVVIRSLKLLGVKGSNVLNNSGVVVGVGGTDVSVEDCELSGMSGIALHASGTDNVRFLRDYVHGLTGDTGYVNSSDISFDQIVSYCTAAFNRLMGGGKTEVGILLQNNSLKHLIFGNQIGAHWSYGIIDYDTTGNGMTFSIISHNRIEDIDGTGALTDFHKGAGIYTAAAGGQIIAHNQIRNTNINTVDETLAPGGVGINGAAGPVLVSGNMIAATNWYGIIVTVSSQAIVLADNVFVEPLKAAIQVKGSSHVSIRGGSITQLTAVPLTQRAIFVNLLGGGGPYSNVSIQGVRIRGSNRAIESDNTNKLNISHNSISEVNGVGIRITNCVGGVVAGNDVDSSANATNPALDLVSVTNVSFTGNSFKSAFASCIVTGGVCTGSVFDQSNVLVGMNMNNVNNAGTGMRFTLYGLGPPTLLNHQPGDRVINSAPAVGQPKSWVCTVAGVPGTWVSEGNL